MNTTKAVGVTTTSAPTSLAQSAGIASAQAENVTAATPEPRITTPLIPSDKKVGNAGQNISSKAFVGDMKMADRVRESDDGVKNFDDSV
jgi:hypothetical protein